MRATFTLWTDDDGGDEVVELPVRFGAMRRMKNGGYDA